MEEASPDPRATAAPRRLTALEPALAALARCLPGPVAPRHVATAHAASWPQAVLARSLVAAAPLPPAPQARRDGWAVAAQDTFGASPQAPVPLPGPPHGVATGDLLPQGTDAVLGPFDIAREFGIAQAIQAAAPGDGARGAGEDFGAGATLRAAGDVLRATDLAVLAHWGLGEIPLRVVRIGWIAVGDEIVATPARDRTGPMLAAFAARAGAEFTALAALPDRQDAIAAGLRAASPHHDLLLLGGGTGDGPQDRSAAGLAAAGALMVHGIGMRPGTSAGFGHVGTCPVLLVPGNPEDALAAWVVLARPALDALTAALARPARRVRLARKLASAVGIAELAALAIDADGGATPLAVGALPLASLTAADGFVLVPAGAEGYEAGTTLPLAPI